MNSNLTSMVRFQACDPSQTPYDGLDRRSGSMSHRSSAENMRNDIRGFKTSTQNYLSVRPAQRDGRYAPVPASLLHFLLLQHSNSDCCATRKSARTFRFLRPSDCRTNDGCPDRVAPGGNSWCSRFSSNYSFNVAVLSHLFGSRWSIN